jgi:hypothetical protein
MSEGQADAQMSSHGHKHPDNAIAALLVVVLEAPV